MEDSITPAPSGNASLTQEQGRQAIADLLNGKPEAATPEVEKHSAPEPVEAEAPDGDEPSTVDEAPDTDDTPEPVRYRLPDGTEATPEEIAEWKRGQLRQADYTRKTQEIAEQRKQFEQRHAEIAQKSQEIDQQINFAIAVAERYLPKPPDASMLESDPIGYLQAKENFDARRYELQQLYHAREQHEHAKSQEQMKSFEEMKAREAQALLDAMPHLKDKSKLEAFQRDIQETLPHYGFSVDDLKSVYDHRLVRLLADAVAFRKLAASKAKVEEKAKAAIPVQPTGKRPSASDGKAADRSNLMRELRKTGDKHTATKLIADLL